MENGVVYRETVQVGGAYSGLRESKSDRNTE